MKKYVFILIMFFFFASSSAAGDFGVSGYGEKWDRWDIGLEITWEVLHLIDWGTTRNMTHRYNEGYSEMNPILGSHPSTSQVDVYMFTGALLHPVVTHLLPKKIMFGDFEIPARRVFQSISIVVSGSCVINNLSVGLQVEF